MTVTDGDGDTATATDELPGDGRQHADAAAALRLRLTMTGCAEGNPASTIGDLNANICDLLGDTSEATFTGELGGSVGSDGAGANGFSFAGLDLTTGTVGTETVTYSWTAGTHTLTATVTGGARSGTQCITG